MNNQLERIWKESSWSSLKYNTRICLHRLSKTKKDLSQAEILSEKQKCYSLNCDIRWTSEDGACRFLRNVSYNL